MISIKLPDGSRKEFPGAVSVAEVAAAIGPGLAKAALAGRVDGTLVDTSYAIDRDADVSIVTERDPAGLDILRHSTAHLLAYAVKELFPEAQVTIGPVIEDGFYYDFSYKRPFTPEDLAAIEAKMVELARKDEPVTRKLMARDDAVAYFKSIGEHYKAEIIASIPSNEPISLYTEGRFTDLCRGPHVPSTGKLKVFRLMKLAGAYWRGDSKNEMLQRIYGTAWAKKDELDAYLTRLEEAEKRDHRKLGRALDLFHLQDEAPGMIFWHPKGWAIWQQVEQYMRRVYQDNGYQEIKCPQILDRTLWEKSGHWQNYKENMFTTESEKHDFAIKPMNCPGTRAGFQLGSAQLSRSAAALRRVRRVPPQRALGRAARHHARARVSPRTTVTSSAPRRRSSPSARRSTGSRSPSTRISASRTSRSSSRCGPRSASAPTSRGTAPKTRCAMRCAPAASNGSSYPAKARSTARRSNIT
jgi:threonyl-tRNA synthetase